MSAGSFTADITAIRKRARQKMEDGPVTGSYGKDPKEVIAVLNEVVATEVVALLVTVMVCGALDVPVVWVPKPRLVGEKLRTVPTPDREAVCGLLGALSVTVRVPVWVPALVGVKTTLMVQLALPAREEPQLLVWL